MIGQVSIRTRACRTGATGDRRRCRSLEKAIHAGARNAPRARDPRQAIRTRRGRRDRLAHRLDLLRAKGLLASMAAILADSNSLSMVISPTLDFSRAISSSRSSRSRSFKADAAPASARSRHSVSLATEPFASRATTSNGSPRNKRATTAILRWTEERFGPASTPAGAPAPAMGERSGAPSGLTPPSIVISKPPVAVHLPQPDVSANRDAPQNLIGDANYAGNPARVGFNACPLIRPIDRAGHRHPSVFHLDPDPVRRDREVPIQRVQHQRLNGIDLQHDHDHPLPHLRFRPRHQASTRSAGDFRSASPGRRIVFQQIPRASQLDRFLGHPRRMWRRRRNRSAARASTTCAEPLASALRTLSSEATKLASSRGVKTRGLGWASPLSTGRPSLIHFVGPPSRMRTSSTLYARGVHQTRAAANSPSKS